MNEQELFDRLERFVSKLEGASDGLERSTEKTREHTEATQEEIAQRKRKKALDETDQREEWAYKARIRKNFDDLGISLKTYKEGNETLSKIEKARVSDMKARQAAEAELNKILEENTSDFKKLSDSQKERYKNELKNEAAMTKALASTGRVFDANGKLVKETDGLTIAQRAHIGILKEQDRVQQQMAGNIGKLGKDIAGLAITSTLNMFVAGIKGAWEGANAYTDAILEGAGANTAAAAQVSAEMNALASAMEATGSSMVSLGMEAGKTALEMIILGGPIGVLVGIIGLLIGATLAYEGYQKQATAATMKRDAELIKKQAAIYDQLYKDFNQVGQASMTTAGGMTQLWKQLNQLGLSTKDVAKFTKIVNESGQALAMFGASSVEGLQKFTDIAEGVKNKFGEVFRRMGIDQDALNEHTLKYMETQVSLGGLEKKNNEQVAAGVKNYVLELDRVATLTGLNRKDLEKGRDAIRAISQLSAAKNVARQEGNTTKLADIELTEKLAGAMQKTMPQMAEALAKFKTGAALDQNQAVMLQYLSPMLDAMKKGETNETRLLEIAGQGIQSRNNQVARNVNVAGEQQGLTMDSFKVLEDFAASVSGSAAKTAAADAKTPPGAPKYDPGEALTALRTSLDTWTNNQLDKQWGAKMEQLAVEQNVQGSGAAMANVMGAAMDEFLPKAFAGPLKDFMEHISAFGAIVKQWAINNPLMAAGVAAGALVAYKMIASKMASIAADKVEDKFVGKLADALGKTGQTGGASTAHTAGTTVAQTASTTAAQTAGTSGTRMERVKTRGGFKMVEVPAGPAAGGAPRMPTAGIPGASGAASGAASSSASEIIKTLAQPDILKNLGTGAGEGLAGFLKAFASPQVVLGAGGLATSIGLIIAGIGAGIAGASWIMGKALPTLMEGIKSFEQLDGKKLEQAGLGIGYLGTGLAVFGVGGAAAGLGSIISNMSDGIASFFGGKTPIDKLVEFSKLDIDGPKVKSNAEAFVAFSEAMAAAGASSVISGIGTYISAVGDGLVKLFGTELPVDKLIKFSKLDIDGPKVKSNAEAFIAFSKAMTSAGVSESVSGVGAVVSSIGDGVNKLLNGKTPIDKFVSFSKLDIDVKRSKNNAEAFVEFSKAFAQGGVAGIAGGFGNMMGGLADGFLAMFGKKDIIDKFVDFANLNIDPKKTKEMAEAFAAFATGMSGGYSGGASAGGAGGGGGGGGGSASGGGYGGAAASGGASSSKSSWLPSWMGGGDKNSGGSDQKPKLATVSSKSGPSTQVVDGTAPAFQKLIDHLDASGYKINSLGGYNDRDVTGQPGVKSVHAKGGALDINPSSNPMGSKLITDFPSNIGMVSNKLGLGWGGDWQSKKDAMHFSAARSEGGTLMARSGGVFNGPPGGYPVELHGREAVVPLTNPGDKISIDKAQQDGSAKKSSLSSVVADTTTSSKDNGSAILMDLYSMMEEKFDDLIDKVNTNNNYTNKLLKYSQV